VAFHRLGILLSPLTEAAFAEATYLGRERVISADERSRMTVWIYVNTRKDGGDKDHFKVFASSGAAEAWFVENDPEGVAFEYPVIA
jgi:hypothetical protein